MVWPELEENRFENGMLGEERIPRLERGVTVLVGSFGGQLRIQGNMLELADGASARYCLGHAGGPGEIHFLGIFAYSGSGPREWVYSSIEIMIALLLKMIPVPQISKFMTALMTWEPEISLVSGGASVLEGFTKIVVEQRNSGPAKMLQECRRGRASSPSR